VEHHLTEAEGGRATSSGSGRTTTALRQPFCTANGSLNTRAVKTRPTSISSRLGWSFDLSTGSMHMVGSVMALDGPDVYWPA
jgi:hypothetical protein